MELCWKFVYISTDCVYQIFFVSVWVWANEHGNNDETRCIFAGYVCHGFLSDTWLNTVALFSRH